MRAAKRILKNGFFFNSQLCTPLPTKKVQTSMARRRRDSTNLRSNVFPLPSCVNCVIKLIMLHMYTPEGEAVMVAEGRRSLWNEPWMGLSSRQLHTVVTNLIEAEGCISRIACVEEASLTACQMQFSPESPQPRRATLGTLPTQTPEWVSTSPAWISEGRPVRGFPCTGCIEMLFLLLVGQLRAP